MPYYSHGKLGEVTDGLLFVGLILEVYSEDDTADVEVTYPKNYGDSKKTFKRVPIFYHCTDDSQLRTAPQNGAIEGSSAAFSPDDEVVVMMKENLEAARIMGFLEGKKPCGFLAYVMDDGYVIADFSLRPRYFTARTPLEAERNIPFSTYDLVSNTWGDVPWELPLRSLYSGGGSSLLRLDNEIVFEGSYSYAQSIYADNYGEYRVLANFSKQYTDWPATIYRCLTPAGLIHSYARLTSEDTNNTAIYDPLGGSYIGPGEGVGCLDNRCYTGGSHITIMSTQTETGYEFTNHGISRKIIGEHNLTIENYNQTPPTEIPATYLLGTNIETLNGPHDGYRAALTMVDLSYTGDKELCGAGLPHLYGESWWKSYPKGTGKDLLLTGQKILFGRGEGAMRYSQLGFMANFSINWVPQKVVTSAFYKYNIQVGNAEQSTSIGVQIPLDENLDHYILGHKATGQLIYCRGFAE